MKFKIDKSVFEKFPKMVEVVPIIYGFNAGVKREEAAKFLDDIENEFLKSADKTAWEADKRVVDYRKVFKDFGAIEGAEPSHVALTKKLLEGSKLPDINTIVNIYNAFSVKYLTPFGGENLDQACGDLVLTLAQGGERWVAIGSTKSKPALVGELIWRDDLDVTCRSWNWRQCDRTKLTPESTNGYFVMDGFKSNKEELIKIANEFIEYVTEYLGGKGEILVLDKENPEAEINFKSKKLADFEVKKVEKKVTEKKYYFLAKLIHDKVGVPITHQAENFGDFAIRGEVDVTGLDMVEKVDKVAEFSNIWLKQEVLISEAEKILNDSYKNELIKVNKEKKFLLEHTSPEPTKTLHIGHFRNNFLGIAIHNILEALGAEVTLDCIDNDRGMKICKTMWGYLVFGNKKRIKGLGIIDYIEKFKAYKITDEEIIKIADGIHWLELLEKWAKSPNDWYKPADFDLASDRFDNVLYSPASRAADLKEEINNQVQEILVSWEKEDKNVRLLWRKIIDWSTEGYERTYKRIGSFHDKVWHESDHYMLGKKWVEKGLKTGVFVKLSDGAILTNLSSYGLADTIVIKKDGTSTYLTQDLQLTYQKVTTYPSDLYIWDIGNDQQLYLQQMYAVCEQLEIIPREKLFHLNYGFITLAGGSKMSSRFGGVINGDDLLDELKAKLKTVILESSSGGKDTDVEEVSEILALGACKYGFLKVDRSKAIIYDIEKSVSIQGDSGPYIQYTYARCRSVINKANSKSLNSKVQINELNTEENSLLRYFYQFSEKIVEAAERYSPAVICEYLLNLTRKYNEFYGKHRIIGEPEEQQRLFLTEVTAKIIRDGLTILGVKTLEKM